MKTETNTETQGEMRSEYLFWLRDHEGNIPLCNYNVHSRLLPSRVLTFHLILHFSRVDVHYASLYFNFLSPDVMLSYLIFVCRYIPSQNIDGPDRNKIHLPSHPTMTSLYHLPLPSVIHPGRHQSLIPRHSNILGAPQYVVTKDFPPLNLLIKFHARLTAYHIFFPS